MICRSLPISQRSRCGSSSAISCDGRIAHGAIILAVLGAVGASVATQFAVKLLVDALSSHPAQTPVRGWPWRRSLRWSPPTICCGASACWIASRTFVEVTGDLRRDLFAPSDRTCAGLFRRAAAGNVDEPHHRDLQRRFPDRNHDHVERAAALRGDASARSFFISRVNATMAAVLVAVAAVVVAAIYKYALSGRPLALRVRRPRRAG